MSEIFFLGNRDRYLRLVTPMGTLFARWGVHPHVLTVVGFLISLAAGFVYAKGAFFWGACLLGLAGVFDTLDGQVARLTNKQSPFGAYFDSTLDRYSDLFPLAGLVYFFSGGTGLTRGLPAGESSPLTVLAIVFSIAGSFMVSYSRARAEALGVECKNGIMKRPERITFLITGSFLGSIPAVGPLLMKCTLFVMAVLTNATAVSRMVHTKRHLPVVKGVP